MGYGVGDLGGNLFFTIMGFWLLNFVTDTLGLAASLAGLALLVGRAWDAVTDPLMGTLSDRTASRWGRRRPYLLFGSLAMVAGMTLVFLEVGGQGWSQGALFAWVVFSFCLVSTAYTVVFIPYAALTPELARDFQERTNLNGYRMAWAIVGTLLGAGAFTIVVDQAAGAGAGEGYTVAGALFGVVSAVVVLITFASVRERPVTRDRAPAGSVFAGYAAALKVRPFRLALFPWALFMTGIVVATSAVPFYFEHLYRRPELASFASLALLLAAFAAIPGWVWLSGRIGKRTAYNAGMVLFGAALLAAYLFAHRDVTVLFVLMALAGVGLATNYVMPWSIIPDVVDYDELENGQRREGVFYGMWTFLQKLGLGAGRRGQRGGPAVDRLRARHGPNTARPARHPAADRPHPSAVLHRRHPGARPLSHRPRRPRRDPRQAGRRLRLTARAASLTGRAAPSRPGTGARLSP